MTSPATRGDNRGFDASAASRAAVRLLGVLAMVAASVLVGVGPARGASSAAPAAATPPWTEVYPQQLPSNSLSCPSRDASHPPCRTNAAMAYDPGHNNVVLFGGYGAFYGEAPDILGDTWIWNGKSWRVVHLPPTSPPPMRGAAMAYDGSHIVLFAGLTKSGLSALGKSTWIWDGTLETWSQLPGTPEPKPRQLASMAFDGSNLVVLFGGVDTAELGDAWLWDGQRELWKPDPTAGGGLPSPRKAAAMAYDPVHSQVVLFGGSNSLRGYFSDTWIRTSTGWAQPTLTASTQGCSGSPTTPAAMDEAAMSYDSVTHDVVMFGGEGIFSPTGQFPQAQGNQDTWLWDGSNPGSWTLVDVCAPGAGPIPPLRHGASMAGNPGLPRQQRVLLFGGIAVDFFNDGWTSSLSGPSPPATTTTTSTTRPATTTTTSTTLPPSGPPRPVVHSVLPVSGPASGGTPVSISGSGLTGATAVSFGDVRLDCARPNTCAVSSGDLHVTSPPHAEGTVDVTVTTAAGTSGIVRDPSADDDLFKYFPPSPPLSNDPAPGSQGIVNSPFQPSLPAPPGGFSSAPVPGGFSSAPVPGSFSLAPAPGALPAASASGSALPAPGAPPPPPGIAPPAAGPVPGLVPLGPTPPLPAAGIPPDPSPAPWPAPYFNMAAPAHASDTGLSPDTMALGAASGVIMLCVGYARRRPAPETAPRSRPAPQHG